MDSKINSNIVNLIESLTNLNDVLTHLLQHGIISTREQEYFHLETKTPTDKKEQLWLLLDKKDFHINETLILDILSKTNNQQCVNILKGESGTKVHKKVSILPKKWWPQEQVLVNSFYERKIGDELIIERLAGMLSGESKTTAIYQSVTVSGLGGIGKTSTAKWYSLKYAEKYDHIVWIDSEEGVLLQSFKNLARALNISDWKHLDVKSLARESFEKLSDLTCLIIFDNAEEFIGRCGIRDLLPFKHQNFHTIITSRNQEWGNSNGIGAISKLLLTTFEENDSLNFFLKNLKPERTTDVTLLKQLSTSLGHLPLALQISVAVINKQDLDIGRYIERINHTNTLLSSNFDDYERTIEATMKISLDQITSIGANGEMASNILLSFGYLQSDNVPMHFFQATEDAELHDIEIAVEILEKYSLITVTQNNWDKDCKYLSIHRLLQQVIRLRSSASNISIIRKLLAAPIPMESKRSIFEHGKKCPELIEEYKILHNYFVEKQGIKELIEEKNYFAALELATLIHNGNKPNEADYATSKYNYALCLDKSGGHEAALELYTGVIKEIGPDDVRHIRSLAELEIVPHSRAIPKHYKVLVAVRCIEINIKLRNVVKAVEMYHDVSRYYYDTYSNALLHGEKAALAALLITAGCKLAKDCFTSNECSGNDVIDSVLLLLKTLYTTFEAWNTFYEGVKPILGNGEELDTYLYLALYQSLKFVKWGETYKDMETFGIANKLENKPNSVLKNTIAKIRRLVFGRLDELGKFGVDEEAKSTYNFSGAISFEYAGTDSDLQLISFDNFLGKLHGLNHLRILTLRKVNIFRSDLVYSLEQCKNLAAFYLLGINLIGNCKDLLHLPQIEIFYMSLNESMDLRRKDLPFYKFFTKLYPNDFSDILQMNYFRISDAFGEIVIVDKERKTFISHSGELLANEFLSLHYFEQIGLTHGRLIMNKFTNVSTLYLDRTKFSECTSNSQINAPELPCVNICNYFDEKLKSLTLRGDNYVVDLSLLRSLSVLNLTSCKVIISRNKIRQPLRELHFKSVAFVQEGIEVAKVYVSSIFTDLNEVTVIVLEGRNIVVDLPIFNIKIIELTNVEVVNCKYLETSSFIIDRLKLKEVSFLHGDSPGAKEPTLLYSLKIKDLEIEGHFHENDRLAININKLSKVLSKLTLHYVDLTDLTRETILNLPRLISLSLTVNDLLEVPDLRSCTKLKVLALSGRMHMRALYIRRFPHQAFGLLNLSTLPNSLSKMSLDNIHPISETFLTTSLDYLDLKNFTFHNINTLLSQIKGEISLINVFVDFESNYVGQHHRNITDNYGIIPLVVEKCRKAIIGLFRWRSSDKQEIEMYGLSRYGVDKKHPYYIIEQKSNAWQGMSISDVLNRARYC